MARTIGANGDDTRARIHAAAERLFAQKGFAAVGIRELAQDAGITPAALYGYMGTKEDLLVSVMRLTIDPLTTAGRELLERYRRPEEQLAALVEMHVWAHGGRPRATLITDTELRSLSEPRRSDMMDRRDGYEQLWRTVIGSGVEQGVFTVLDERVATIAVLELATGVASWYRPSKRLDLQTLCAIHADLALSTVNAVRGRRRVRREHLSIAKASDILSLSDISPESGA